MHGSADPGGTCQGKNGRGKLERIARCKALPHNRAPYRARTQRPARAVQPAVKNRPGRSPVRFKSIPDSGRCRICKNMRGRPAGNAERPAEKNTRICGIGASNDTRKHSTAHSARLPPARLRPCRAGFTCNRHFGGNACHFGSAV